MKPPDLARSKSDDYHNDDDDQSDDDDDDKFDMCLNDMIYSLFKVFVVYLNAQHVISLHVCVSVFVYVSVCACMPVCVCVCVCMMLTRAQLI